MRQRLKLDLLKTWFSSLGIFWITLFQLGFGVFGKYIELKLFDLRVRDDPTTWSNGVESRVSGTNLHVLFIDYDDIRADVLEEELVFLQNEFKLGNFYIFRTKESGMREDGIPFGCYHAICLDVDTIRRYYHILQHTSTEYAFQNAPKIYPERAWVLRWDRKGERGKPAFLTTVESPYEGEKLQSTAHAMYIDQFYGTDIEANLTNPDGNTVLRFCKYNTASKVKA